MTIDMVYMLQMYNSRDDSPSLWDLGTGQPYMENRTIPAAKAHLQLTCRNCGTARWYIHRVAPISANPLPVFSIVSPLWDNGEMAYERVRPPTELPPTGHGHNHAQPMRNDYQPAANVSKTLYTNEYNQTVTDVPLPILTIDTQINERTVADKGTPVSEAPMTSLSAMLEPFTYDAQEKQTLVPNELNLESFENTQPIIIPNSAHSITTGNMEGEVRGGKEIKKPLAKELSKFKNMDGHKHLRGNTTWSPVTKRGRHEGHRHNSSSKKIEKKNKLEKPPSTLTSMTHSKNT